MSGARTLRAPAMLAIAAVLAAAGAREANASSQSVNVGARVITSCRVAGAERAAVVTVRCTGDVALQAVAGRHGARPGAASPAQGIDRRSADARQTVLQARRVLLEDGEPGGTVTIMF